MSYNDHSSSVIRLLSVRPSTTVNNSETPGPILFKILLEPFVNVRLKICTHGLGPLIKMVKTLRNLLLQNQESFKAEYWYIALETQGLRSLLK